MQVDADQHKGATIAQMTHARVIESDDLVKKYTPFLCKESYAKFIELTVAYQLRNLWENKYVPIPTAHLHHAPTAAAAIGICCPAPACPGLCLTCSFFVHHIM
jgi:hypothetical protein